MAYVSQITGPAYSYLLELIHDWIVGLTGLDGALVRPRWQTEPAMRPTSGGFNAVWISFGIENFEPDFTFFERRTATEYRQAHWEKFRCLVSVYGIGSVDNACKLRDAWGIEDNRQPLLDAGVAIVDVSDLTNVPELYSERFWQRVDLTITFRRQVVRTYPIEQLVNATVKVHTEGVDPRDITGATDGQFKP